MRCYLLAIALLPSDHERVPDLGSVEKFFRGRSRIRERGGINFIRPGVIVEQYLKVITKMVVRLIIFFSTRSTIEENNYHDVHMIHVIVSEF